MTIRRPSREELSEIAKSAHFPLNEEELDDYAELVAGTLDVLERMQEIPEPRFAPHNIKYEDRCNIHRPEPAENPHNIWVTKATVEGADSGPLAGKTIGLKDNISLAGVEMTNGSQLFEGYVPDIDATIVTRLLDAGGTIEGKLNMESFAFSGSSDTSDFGTVTNPRAPEYIAGGSSSGSGAAPAAGEVDIAIGGDQGGSIRIPASCCGVVGLKPTTGLVPYTGIFPIDNSLDHTGPMAESVEDVATALEVMAGPDGLDPRQPAGLEGEDYTDSLVDDAEGMTIAVLKEGFEREESDPEVNATVREAIETLEELGAETTEVSVPRHLDSLALWIAIAGYGGIQVLKQGGLGSLYDGWYNTGLAKAYDKFRKSQGRDFPDSVKATWLAIEYLDQEYQGSALYGKGQNISLTMRAAYDEILEEADVIAMPTIPIKPFEVDPDLSRIDRIGRSLGIAKNTAPFDLTHHPAISVPCGTAGGRPVGLMFVGERFDEASVFQAAYTYQENAEE
ncbi:amidase [Haladaptatus sp. CMSO5]|uniref:amidase n=1 Tax=Haladaptatus sp. CMSO5 TaxID=3120514 RepID=UPI002FCDE8C7